MKRFRSPFQKIQRIQQQQLRIAELALAQAQLALRMAEQHGQWLMQRQVEMEQAITKQLGKRNSTLNAGVVRSTRDELESCKIRIIENGALINERSTQVRSATEAYRDLKARCDGVGKLIAGKQLEHRRNALRDEQTVLDESSRVAVGSLSETLPKSREHVGLVGTDVSLPGSIHHDNMSAQDAVDGVFQR